MKKILALIQALIILTLIFCGCADTKEPKTLLDPDDPVTLTMWHVYGEQADSPMNLLIKEFNDTVGREKGVIIHVSNVTSTSKIQAQLLDAKAKKPGAPDLPDLFSCHTQNAPALGTDDLIDWKAQFTEEELAAYVPEFIDSGMIGDKLAVFPTTKSTYALFISGSQFDRFSADTGVSYDDLSTWEGFFDAASKYREWSGGKAFCALDYLVRHIELDVLSKGGKLEYTSSGWYDENDPMIKDSFTMFASALAMGDVVVSRDYANKQVMTGEVLSGIGSSAAVSYYNDTITYPDNTSEPMDLKILPLPKSGGEVEYMPQTGVGIASFKTTDQKAEAAGVFVKWFTESGRNLDFAVKTGYMPVASGAFEAIDSYTFEDPSYSELFGVVKTMIDGYTPVVRPDMEGFYDKTKALYDGMRELCPTLAERYGNGEDIGVLTDELWELFCSVA